MLRAVPFYRRTVMRKGAIRGLDADVAQAAVVNVLVTHAHVAEDKVQDVASAIFTARDELPRLNALFDGIGELFTPLRSEGARASNSAALRFILALSRLIAQPDYCGDGLTRSPPPCGEG